MTENNWSWETLDPEAFYDDLGHGEWERLERDFYHQLEWRGTIEYLEQYLPESGRILDAGGAAGRYTVWLAKHGYDVTLIDISNKQLEIAREKLSERELGEAVTVESGDVRDLTFDAETFDATLCLGGPLSHILDESERKTAVSELERVTKADAPVFVSVMGRLALVQAIIQQTGEIPNEEDEAELLPELAEQGTYNRSLLEKHGRREPTLFGAHFFRVAELESLFENGGFDVEQIVGLEGIASLRRIGNALDDVAPGKRNAIKDTIQLLREDETVADISTHILAVGRVE
jgi:S-adenosylmethionine-dependent methyltransferase